MTKLKTNESDKVNLASPDVNIIIDYKNWHYIEPELASNVKLAVIKTISVIEIDEDIELSIRLTSDLEMKELNHKYRGKPSPTNVLAFSQEKDSDLLFKYNRIYIGDIAIGYESVHKESCDQKKTLSAHLIHLIIHGLLHLIGYSHKNKIDSKVMEGIEIKVLGILGYKNPYSTELID